MWTRLKNSILRWAARQGARKLSTWLPEQLADLKAEYANDQAVTNAIEILARIVDPQVRTPEMTLRLRRFSDALQQRALETEGQLDDGTVVLLRGALNTLPDDPKKGWA